MYLIIKCEELNDQYECDYNRIPLCLTEDCSKYGVGYEVYKINKDNTFSLMKESDTAIETGMCVVIRDDNDNIIGNPEKFPNKTSFSKNEIKKLKSKYRLTDTVNEIFCELSHNLNYGCAVNDKYVMLGKYRDDRYPRE